VTSSLRGAMAASKSRRLNASITSRTAWTFSCDIQLQYRRDRWFPRGDAPASRAKGAVLRITSRRLPRTTYARLPRVGHGFRNAMRKRAWCARRIGRSQVVQGASVVGSNREPAFHGKAVVWSRAGRSPLRGRSARAVSAAAPIGRRSAVSRRIARWSVGARFRGNPSAPGADGRCVPPGARATAPDSAASRRAGGVRRHR
jgi:hypothetical protein